MLRLSPRKRDPAKSGKRLDSRLRGNERIESPWAKYALPTRALQQRRDSTHCYAAVFPTRPFRLHFGVLFAVALGHQIFRRNLIIARQNVGDGFGPSIGQREIILVRTDLVGMALDQEHF